MNTHEYTNEDGVEMSADRRGVFELNILKYDIHNWELRNLYIKNEIYQNDVAVSKV
jgi:hypothetical protein